MDGKTYLSDQPETVDRMKVFYNVDAPPRSLVGRKRKMSQTMQLRLVFGLSARAISIMMRSGDFNLWESNPAFPL